MMRVKDIKRKLTNDVIHGNFVTDKTGQKTVEIIGASFVADEPAIFGTPNEEYIEAELEWYKSQSTNIFDIYEDRQPPKAWTYAADRNGNINSNYGKLIYSGQYHNQYVNVMCELRRNRDSRRATMVYNRPSIWCEFDTDGKSDFQQLYLSSSWLSAACANKGLKVAPPLDLRLMNRVCFLISEDKTRGCFLVPPVTEEESRSFRLVLENCSHSGFSRPFLHSRGLS